MCGGNNACNWAKADFLNYHWLNGDFCNIVGRSPGLYTKLIAASYSMHAAGFAVMVLVNIMIALTVNIARPMMWYTNNWLTVPVYVLPGLAVWIIIHQHGKDLYSNIFQVYIRFFIEYSSAIIGLSDTLSVKGSRSCPPAF